MEGGYLPWKRQHVDKNIQDIDYYQKCLPPPPSGFIWSKKSDGNWELCKFQNENNPEVEKEEVKEPTVIEHIIMAEDTFQGICLRYNVSAVELRRLNMFSGNNIQIKSSLLIPLKKGAVPTVQIVTREVILQQFRNATGEGIQEAKLYLDENEWNLSQAVTAWKNDETWNKEEENNEVVRKHHHTFSVSLPEDDDHVVALAVEPAKTIAPLAVRYQPPTSQDIEMIAASSKNTKYGNDIANDPAAMPLLLG